MVQAVELDVRDLEPPEPLDKAIDALHNLQAGQYLVFIHRREPVPLYPMAEEMGFRHRMEQVDAMFRVYFWRPMDKEVHQYLKSL